jgi:hypothetical protein
VERRHDAKCLGGLIELHHFGVATFEIGPHPQFSVGCDDKKRKKEQALNHLY